ncbi:uncharacterized protein LOC126681491 [Mercurialis annua]|uniref:uncharacterized protein LOC126681491 n=1 Tax=Mercurialis annua TaxID=3986 RepID=UPI00215ECE08|nr:uncharacterized protein LOC126681491 [Mercurialis annua]
MTIFVLPISVTKKLESLASKFWWNEDVTKRSIHWLRWSKLTNPKLEGGIGFKRMAELNLSLAAKQSWKLLNDTDSLWATTLKENFKLHHPTTRPENINLVADLTLPNSSSWNLDLIQETFSEEESKLILSIPIGHMNAADSLIWHYTNSGIYSAKSGYKLLTSNPGGDNSHLSSFWKSIWNLGGPPKLSCFIWRCATNSFVVQSNFQARNISAFATCKVCNQEDETLTHMLFHCPTSKQTWFASNLGIITQNMNFNSFIDWWIDVSDYLANASMKGQILRVAYICWNICLARYALIFHQKVVDPIATVRAALQGFTSHPTSCNQLSALRPSSSPTAKWLLPPSGR